jgi:Dolichyl-phosphate-mannose-protein mannosyltransferase
VTQLVRPAVRVPALPDVEIAAPLFWRVVGACTLGVAAFLAYAVTAWRPHEDEVLELFTGRGTIGDLYGTVFHRGGAPLHFTLAWAVVHLGGGLTALRVFSALFAVLSIPVVALLVRRLAGTTTAIVATPLLAFGWTLLFHGVYARMYSLFLLTSALSYLALLNARDRRGWALWGIATLAMIATHTYGAIVLASQVLWILVARPVPLRKAFWPFAAVGVLGLPFWWIDLVLAGRYDIGVGSGGSRLSGPVDVLRYFVHVGADFSVGRRWYAWPVLVLVAVGIARLPRRSALLVAAVFVTPLAIFLGAKVGSSASPETRHMIFALPFFPAAIAAGVIRVFRRPVLIAVAVAALCAGELTWAMQRAPELFRSEAVVRVSAREAASAWLARTARRDDVLLGYDPIFLGAWERGGAVSRTVVPRADPVLALKALRAAPKPLGRGVFVLDASDTNNYQARLYVGALSPLPRGAFEVRSWGPFLILRTRAPTRTPEEFLARAREAELLGKGMLMGDADVNYATVSQALSDLGR